MRLLPLVILGVLFVVEMYGALTDYRAQATSERRAPGLLDFDAALLELGTALDRIEMYIDKGPYAVGSQLTNADCALVPMLFFVTRLPAMLGTGDSLEGRTKIASWWQGIAKDPHASRVMG